MQSLRNHQAYQHMQNGNPRRMRERKGQKEYWNKQWLKHTKFNEIYKSTHSRNSVNYKKDKQRHLHQDTLQSNCPETDKENHKSSKREVIFHIQRDLQ